MKKNSIKRLILYTFLSTAAILIISISFIIKMNQDYNKQTKTLFNNNRYFTDLLVVITKINHSYEQIDKNKEIEENIPIYKQELYTTLKVLSHIVIIDSKTQMFYRTIQNQLVYIDELEGIYFDKATINTKKYETWGLLRTAYTILSYQCNSMLEQYLIFASNRFTSLEKQNSILEQRLYIMIGLGISINYLYIAGSIYRVLKQLTIFKTHSLQLSNGNWEIDDIKNCTFEELDMVGNTFNTMKHNISKQMIEINKNILLEKQLHLLKQSQLKSLQQQMNPHFLYNTLNIISRLAMFDGNEKVVHLMESTARILRYNMEHTEHLVSLKKEVDIALDYIEIQQTRFGERIQFQMDIQDFSLLDQYQIPPMILQPLIENSVKHGLKDKIEHGLLIITISEEVKGCSIVVYDNGNGIPDHQIHGIFNKTSSIGLKNVKERLHLCFPNHNSIEVFSQENQWTKVLIFLPKPS